MLTSTPPRTTLLFRPLKRFLHLMFGGLGAFAEAVKDAADDLRANSGILLSMLGKVAWLIPLVVVPHLFLTFRSFYAGFRDVGPEWGWALASLALAALDAVALARRSYWAQMVTLFVGMFVWWFLSSLAAHGAPRGWMGLPGAPSAYIYGFAALACLIGLIRTGQRHSARCEAENYMIIARWAEEELSRGAHWTRRHGNPVRPADQAGNSD